MIISSIGACSTSELASRDEIVIVTNSSITKVVVSAAAERVGFKSIKVEAQEAIDEIAERRPAAVIFDSSCQEYLANLSSVVSDWPFMISIGSAPFPFAVDAIIAKPVTMDDLQPVLRRLSSAKAVSL